MALVGIVIKRPCDDSKLDDIKPIVMKELFIVEGRSAADALSKRIKPQHQQVLAMQGKPPNVKRLSRKRILTNLHCRRLFDELASGIENNCSPSKMRYRKVILLTDADVDGLHSLALLVGLFRMYLHSILVSGRIYILRPPLFRLVNPYHDYCDYAFSELEKNHLLNSCVFECEITRFRGIAQLSGQELDWLLNKVKRQQLVVPPPNPALMNTLDRMDPSLT